MNLKELEELEQLLPSDVDLKKETRIAKMTVTMNDPKTKSVLSKKNTGKKLSTEIRTKMSESHTGKIQKPFTKEHKDKLSKVASERTFSAETRKKLSDLGKKNKALEKTQVAWICEHCGKEGVGSSNYKRWHGDNCKEKT